MLCHILSACSLIEPIAPFACRNCRLLSTHEALICLVTSLPCTAATTLVTSFALLLHQLKMRRAYMVAARNWINMYSRLAVNWFLRHDETISSLTPKTSHDTDAQSQQRNNTNPAILTEAFASENARCKAQQKAGHQLNETETTFLQASSSARDSMINSVYMAYCKDRRVSLK